MNKIKYLVSVLSVLITVLSLPSSAAQLDISDLDKPKVIEAFVDGVVISSMKKYHNASGVVAIRKNGKLIFSKGYGYQDIAAKVPVEEDNTLFRPGSISKLFTWVSVMQMVEQGKLDLDADINQYLKTFKIKDAFPGQPVTMKSIMTHTAGFEDGVLGYLIINDVDRIIPLAEAMKKYQIERVNPPGKQTAYSNYAASLAGLIVSNLSGLEFSEYVQTHIFDVLNMKSSSFKEPLPEYLNKNMAVANDFVGGRYVEKPFELIANFLPAGGLSSTATDILTFSQAILNGGEYDGHRILKEETVKQMLTRNFSQDDRLMGMALGFYESEYNGLRFVGHGGDTFYFHSNLIIDQQNDITFFVSFSGANSVIRSSFTGAFYDAFFPTKKELIVSPSDFSVRANKYAGTYIFWRSSFSKIDKVLSLFGGIPVRQTADNTLIVSLGDQIDQYAEIDHNLFQSVNGQEQIAFQEDKDGNITGMILGGLPFMSTFKAPIYYKSNFNFFLIGLSLFVFIAVILRRLYQKTEYQLLVGDSKKAARAALISSVINVLTVLLVGIVLAVVGTQMFYQIPLLFKLWLFFPILVLIAGIYLSFQTFKVWKNSLFTGFWSRFRYSFVAACSLFMCWFYFFWNILGFQYYE